MTTSDLQAISFQLSSLDNKRLANLCGSFDEHLHQIERTLHVVIQHRSGDFKVKGEPQDAHRAVRVIQNLYAETAKEVLNAQIISLFLQSASVMESPHEFHIAKRSIKPHGLKQQNYVDNIQRYDINFGIGPAGTGKTYLAVAAAVAAYEKEQISRILLVRPAVEAGEKLGFLPGDFSQKLDPYFRPLYDALYEMLGFNTVMKLLEQHVIELAPLAYMRGRTLNDAFIILDEAQNTTKEQMKMFLTRIGFNSKVVITGDTTQIDLPKGYESGLIHCSKILKDVVGITFTYFATNDVVRHPIVQRILTAYENYEETQS